MGEEFQESDIIFLNPEDDSCVDNRKHTHLPVGRDAHNFQEHGNGEGSVRRMKKKKKKRNRPRTAASVPIQIPDRMFQWVSEDDLLEELEWEGGGMVPPHLIVARRMAGGNMAFSVRSGNGRKLKGRDFFRVRNSVLRMTGFLET